MGMIGYAKAGGEMARYFVCLRSGRMLASSPCPLTPPTISHRGELPQLVPRQLHGKPKAAPSSRRWARMHNVYVI